MVLLSKKYLSITMAKRGRKPKERKGYFYENEEQAVIDYINSDNAIEKNEIFNKYLYPAFIKMIESIIRRYNLYCTDEEFQQTFDDTLSYLMSKISHYRHTIYEYEEIEVIPDGEQPEFIDEKEEKRYFKNANENSPEYIVIEYNDGEIKCFKLKEKKYKAFSYCQTVVKNYLMYKRMQVVKEQQRNTPYDVVSDAFENDKKYSTEEVPSYILAEKLIKETNEEIKKILNNSEEFNLSEKEKKVGYALCDLFENNNWEKLIREDDSNKLLKSSVLYFLREETMMTTKEIRDNCKRFKKLYYFIKKEELE